jgi:alkanesulfonate monooxygenase SsuD/methylene tetrahydromethanopterin reductase-like flavin-dependent oxidoreductase (luciferase family)
MTTSGCCEDKTNLFAELLKGGPVTWQGTTRAALHAQDVVPHTEFGPFPVWLGVGGSPESVARTTRYGFSLMLAIIGGPPTRFAPFARLFRDPLQQLGQAPRPVGVHAPGHVAASDTQAVEEFGERWIEVIRRVSRERGFRPPTRESFITDVGPQGALYVGSPETVAQKIVANLTALEATRFDLKFGMPGLAQDTVMTNIELYGTHVIRRSASSGAIAPPHHLPDSSRPDSSRRTKVSAMQDRNPRPPLPAAPAFGARLPGACVTRQARMPRRRRSPSRRHRQARR